MRISDWSSDVCSSDLLDRHPEMLRDRGINVTSYRNSYRSVRGEKITSELKQLFSAKSEEERHEPILGLTFMALDSYETEHLQPEAAGRADALSDWAWASWLIDVADTMCVFWYVPKRSAIGKFIEERGRNGVFIP